ncbi:glycosyltransferase [Spirosoma koreense]
MKIAMSADCFYPAQMGGPSNAIYWQAKALTQAGHDVTVVATSQDLPPDTPLDRWLSMGCGRVIYTRNPHFYLPLKHMWFGWQAIRQADVIHVNSLFYPASLVWVMMSRLAGKPVVWSPHGEVSSVALTYRPGLKQKLLNVIRRFSSSVWFHATSDVEMADIQHYIGRKVRVGVIRNMMELPMRDVPEPPASPYLLFIGRVHPIKAIDRLLVALSDSTLFRNDAYSLQIVGPGVDTLYVQQLQDQVQALGLTGKVIFRGAVHGLHKEQLYANARVTILPSHAENFGNVVIESLAQGTPVVASTGTPWQRLETEGVGSWVSNDPAVLRQTIDTYLTMPIDTYRAYRKRAVALVYRDYDIAKNVPLWTQFYEKVLAEASRKNSGDEDQRGY